jgi:RHS repeat-associated protein
MNQALHSIRMLMPGRHASTADYRYGFNGMEKDDEVKGEGNHLDFGARCLDVRLGRFMTMDPASSKYPEVSDYSFVLNNPIIFIDPDGREVTVSAALRADAAKGERVRSIFQGLINDENQDGAGVRLLRFDVTLTYSATGKLQITNARQLRDVNQFIAGVEADVLAGVKLESNVLRKYEALRMITEEQIQYNVVESDLSQKTGIGTDGLAQQALGARIDLKSRTITLGSDVLSMKETVDAAVKSGQLPAGSMPAAEENSKVTIKGALNREISRQLVDPEKMTVKDGTQSDIANPGTPPTNGGPPTNRQGVPRKDKTGRTYNRRTGHYEHR